ncbi:MAG TPA: hypothetical protein VGS41_08385 [Chthonomonadales bacterium]|nr:hypothetical protein [Chthonomonadales bacterium]
MTVLAIDPGTAKCGIALLGSDGKVLYRAVLPVDQVLGCVQAQIECYHPHALVIGLGCGSGSLVSSLRAAVSSLPIETIDEKRSSEEARRRFVRENRPIGWQRLLPRSLRSPWRPYDDYVAVILAERYMAALRSDITAESPGGHDQT